MLNCRIFVALAGLILLAAALALAVAHLDRAIVDRFYHSPPALLPAMRVITLYGSWFVLLPAGVLGMFFAMHHHRLDLAIRLGAGMLAGLFLTEGLKLAISRARPEVIERISVSGKSFPSGHALDSVVVWSFLALLVWRLGYKQAWVRILYVIPVMVGWSRVYLGAHWPSDVLGGWGLGLLVLAAIAGSSRRAPARAESSSRPQKP
jgi:undecaprenyl-diphosphatase